MFLRWGLRCIPRISGKLTRLADKCWSNVHKNHRIGLLPYKMDMCRESGGQVEKFGMKGKNIAQWFVLRLRLFVEPDKKYIRLIPDFRSNLLSDNYQTPRESPRSPPDVRFA